MSWKSLTGILRAVLTACCSAVLMVLTFRTDGHALCAAKPGTMSLKGHGKLLLKGMLGTSCQGLGTTIASPSHSSVLPHGF